MLLAIVVLSTAGTYVLSSRTAPSYQSSTQVYVGSTEIQDILSGAQAGGTDRSTADQAKLLLSAPVARAVVQRLDLRESPTALMSTVTATPVPGSNFVVVTAQRRSGTQAAAVANAYVREYLVYRQSQLTRDALTAISSLQAQLARIPHGPGTQPQRQGIQDTIREVRAAEAAAPSEASQTQTAEPPQSPTSPRPKRDAAFALAIALGFGLALAFGLERFDRRIKSVDEVAEAYGLPLISVIPHAPAAIDIGGGKASVPASLREPFRSLRTNLQLASPDKPIRRLLVASAAPGEGKSTIVRNLALTYQEFGLSVVVVEADLRRPTLSATFAVGAGVGLTSVLIGECDLEEALVEVAIGSPSAEYLDKLRLDGQSAPRRAASATASGGRVMLLSSGPTPPNPPAVLAADTMRAIVDELSEVFDIVLIDTPPLLVVSDAVALLPQADGVVLITRVGRTDRQSAKRAADTARLDSTVNVLGVVANDVTHQGGSGYGYGYGYG
jgi:Mrp family chromosome partitioning ATPase/capsular polysaccharide biosynthesis protein